MNIHSERKLWKWNQRKLWLNSKETQWSSMTVQQDSAGLLHSGHQQKCPSHGVGKAVPCKTPKNIEKEVTHLCLLNSFNSSVFSIYFNIISFISLLYFSMNCITWSEFVLFYCSSKIWSAISSLLMGCGERNSFPRDQPRTDIRALVVPALFPSFLCVQNPLTL